MFGFDYMAWIRIVFGFDYMAWIRIVCGFNLHDFSSRRKRITTLGKLGL